MWRQKLEQLPSVLPGPQKRTLYKRMLAIGVLSAFTTASIGFLLASSFDPNERLHRIHIAANNKDDGELGEAILDALLNSSLTIVYSLQNATEMQQAVKAGKVWGGIYIPQNLTNDWNAALRGEREYTSKVQVILDEGRSPVTHDLIKAAVIPTIEATTFRLRLHRLQQPLVGDSAGSPTYAWAIASTLQVERIRLHPVSSAGYNTAAGLMLILIWVNAALIIGTNRSVTTDLELLLQPYQVHIIRMGIAVGLGVIGTFFFTTVWHVFGLTAAKGGFVSLWGWYFVSTFAFVGVIGATTNLLGWISAPLNAVLLVFQVASCGVSYSEELLPPIFFVGKLMPMYHSLQGTRTILFGADNNLVTNCIVLILYCLGASLLSYIALFRTIKNRIRPLLSVTQGTETDYHGVTEEEPDEGTATGGEQPPCFTRYPRAGPSSDSLVQITVSTQDEVDAEK